MKILLTISTLAFTLMFSSTSFAEWTEVSKNIRGDTFYVDFERIRKVDGYVYYWQLTDLLKPTQELGVLSAEIYHEGDCNLFRFKVLSNVFHQQSMGRDVGKTFSPKNPEWEYPRPTSVTEIVLNTVCRVAE